MTTPTVVLHQGYATIQKPTKTLKPKRGKRLQNLTGRESQSMGVMGQVSGPRLPQTSSGRFGVTCSRGGGDSNQELHQGHPISTLGGGQRKAWELSHGKRYTVMHHVFALLAKGQLTRGWSKNVRMLTKLNRSRLDSGSNRSVPNHVAYVASNLGARPSRSIEP